LFEIKHVITFLIAIIPALIWLYLFLRKQNENKWLVLFTFLGGMLAAQLILVYQGYWDETINFIFFKVSLVDFKTNIEHIIVNTLLSTFVIFLGVGVMEEFLKFWVMKFISARYFRSINDVIELAIISALGFAFLENMIYFSSQWGQLSAGNFFVFAMFRVTIVTMVHVLCSGIFGYYFGMAFFASPLLKIEQSKRKKHVILRLLKKIFRFKKHNVYYNEMFIIGLVSAMVIHALYDFVLSINVSILGFPVFIPVMFLYFFGGYYYLNYLLQKKNSHLQLGLVGTKVMPQEDFRKLLEEIEELKEKMREGQSIEEKPMLNQSNPIDDAQKEIEQS